MKKLKLTALIAALTVTFAGCGKVATPATQAAASEWDGEEDSSAEEPAAAEEAPSANGSTDAADYWKESDYFDLVGYLMANGADDVYPRGKDPSDPNSELYFYFAHFCFRSIFL